MVSTAELFSAHLINSTLINLTLTSKSYFVGRIEIAMNQSPFVGKTLVSFRKK